MTGNEDIPFGYPESFDQGSSTSYPTTDPAQVPPPAVLCFDLNAHVRNLLSFGETIKKLVDEGLSSRVSGQWTKDDDAIFQSFNLFVGVIIGRDGLERGGLESFAAELWAKSIWPLVRSAEERLRRGGSNFRIHNGAPFFNVGLCCFLSRDFDRAIRYLTEAGLENELSGRGSRHQILSGENFLAQKVIIDPIIDDIGSIWGSDYRAISSMPLTKEELRSLLDWLVKRAPDALQTVTALHRLRVLQRSMDNEAARFQVVRGLADIVLAIESSLRRWQMSDGELHKRIEKLLSVNTGAFDSFQSFHTAHGGCRGPIKRN